MSSHHPKNVSEIERVIGSSTINAKILKTNLATIHRHVNIFFITSYFTLQQVKVSIEIVFRSQLTRKDDNCPQPPFWQNFKKLDF
jgi:hypothetical protein